MLQSAPMAEASVGEATPAKMEPSTATIRTSGGTRDFMTRTVSARRETPAGSRALIDGAAPGRTNPAPTI